MIGDKWNRLDTISGMVLRSRRPSNEIGAKEDSRWLGIAWNELVKQTRKQRKR